MSLFGSSSSLSWLGFARPSTWRFSLMVGTLEIALIWSGPTRATAATHSAFHEPVNGIEMVWVEDASQADGGLWRSTGPFQPDAKDTEAYCRALTYNCRNRGYFPDHFAFSLEGGRLVVKAVSTPSPAQERTAEAKPQKPSAPTLQATPIRRPAPRPSRIANPAPAPSRDEGHPGQPFSNSRATVSETAQVRNIFQNEKGNGLVTDPVELSQVLGKGQGRTQARIPAKAPVPAQFQPQTRTRNEQRQPVKRWELGEKLWRFIGGNSPEEKASSAAEKAQAEQQRAESVMQREIQDGAAGKPASGNSP